MTFDRGDTISPNADKQPADKQPDSQLSLVSMNPPEETSRKCTEDSDIKERANVGPYLSTQINIDTYCKGAAHPSDSHQYKTIDTRTGKELELSDVFKKEDIYHALMKDEFVQRALKSEHEHPKNYDQLLKDLNKDNGLGTYVFKDRHGDNPIDMYVNGHMLKNFSFHHLADHGNKVAVRLLPDYGAEVSRNQMWQLGIYLPTPAGLKAEFMKAAQGKNGEFLMKDSDTKGKLSSQHREFEDKF